MRILGLSGSLRERSSNTALLIAAQSLAPAPVSLDLLISLGDLPHFNPDLDDQPPPEVAAFRQEVADAQALLISTPEYAHGIPGVLKNALDWLVSDTQFAGKPVGLFFGSASEGGFAQAALVEVLKTMSARVVPEAVVSVPGARVKFDGTGRLVDPRLSEELSKALQALVRAIKSEEE